MKKISALLGLYLSVVSVGALESLPLTEGRYIAEMSQYISSAQGLFLASSENRVVGHFSLESLKDYDKLTQVGEWLESLSVDTEYAESDPNGKYILTVYASFPVKEREFSFLQGEVSFGNPVQYSIFPSALKQELHLSAWLPLEIPTNVRSVTVVRESGNQTLPLDGRGVVYIPSQYLGSDAILQLRYAQERDEQGQLPEFEYEYFDFGTGDRVHTQPAKWGVVASGFEFHVEGLIDHGVNPAMITFLGETQIAEFMVKYDPEYPKDARAITFFGADMPNRTWTGFWLYDQLGNQQRFDKSREDIIIQLSFHAPEKGNVYRVVPIYSMQKG